MSGQRRRAVRELHGALAEAAPEGLVRVFADEAWVLRDMLANSAARRGRPGEAALLSFAKRVAEACGPSLASPQKAAPSEGARETLSPREIEVLAMLSRGLSNKQMARDLSRSEATIATHLRRIYERLGAHTRTQAIAIARRGGLIDSARRGLAFLVRPASPPEERPNCANEPAREGAREFVAEELAHLGEREQQGSRV